MNSKVGELDNEVREIFSSQVMNELTGVFQVSSGKGRLLVRFNYGCEKYLTSNQIIIDTVEKSPVAEESELPIIYVIPSEIINL